MKILRELRKIIKLKHEVKLNGKKITFLDVLSCAGGASVEFEFSQKQIRQIKDCYHTVIFHTRKGTPIYGINTAYGAQVSRILSATKESERIELAKELSKAILHTDTSVGQPIKKEVTKAAMLVRLHTLSQGYSGICLEDLDLLRQLINSPFTPIVGQYGSLGASGDLAQNGRVLSVLLQERTAKVWDEKDRVLPAKNALRSIHMKPLKLRPKNGLGFVNGDNFSIAAATLTTLETSVLMYLNSAVSALMFQVLKGSNRSLHPMLSAVRNHKGQALAASLYRKFLKSSKLIRDELTQVGKRETGIAIQDKYSLRALPQYTGPDWEKLEKAWETMEVGINGVSDNPLFVSPELANTNEEPWSWVSGANFLGMYAADTLDDLRKVLTRLVKLNDRHLATLVNANGNNGLPSNLSDKQAISQCTMKGLQNLMGMMEVYSVALSTPITTLFGVHEEGNQDVTAHGLTSWILGNQLLDLAKYSIATNLIAGAQAVDLRGGKLLLSPKTRFLYEFTREKVPYIKKEQPMGHYVQVIFEDFQTINSLLSLVKKLS